VDRHDDLPPAYPDRFGFSCIFDTVRQAIMLNMRPLELPVSQSISISTAWGQIDCRPIHAIRMPLSLVQPLLRVHGEARFIG
jgi:hypothetical protein